MREIALTKGFVALVDDEDYENVSRFRWSAITPHNVSYAQSVCRIDGKRRTIKMHRIVMDEHDSSVLIDHINGNGLDNRRANLRRVCASDNQANMRSVHDKKSSKYKGVCYRSGRWFAQIQHKKVKYTIGYFTTEEEAAIAYNRAATERFGEYAFLNNVTCGTTPKRRIKNYSDLIRDASGRYISKRGSK